MKNGLKISLLLMAVMATLSPVNGMDSTKALMPAANITSKLLGTLPSLLDIYNGLKNLNFFNFPFNINDN